MRLERQGHTTAVQRLQDGRLYFEKIIVVEKITNRPDDPGALDEILAHFRVDDQISVAPTVPGFDVD